MKIIDLHQVDAFTNVKFGGNPAGVVTNADGLSDEIMIKIAREMNLSETAFVLSPTSDAADLKLRFFTPSSAEIDFCGHATVGTLYELSRLSMYGLGKKGQNKVRVETNAGIINMSVTCDTNDKAHISFAAPGVDMQDYRLQGQAFADEFGIPVGALRPESKVLIDRKLNYVYVPIASLDQLGKLQFDLAKMRVNFAAENIIIFSLFTDGTFDKKSDIHVRVIGPLIGIDEDPFTGSNQSGLIHAAKQVGAIDANKENLIVEQGNFIGRPSFATIKHNIKTDDLLVTANAAQVFSTKMEIE
jgi:PhzF family phenazine biosynthesis protein